MGHAFGERVEKDSLGEVRVPADRLWGAQTQRSLEHFTAGGPRFRWGRAMIRAMGIAKKCAALANGQLQQLGGEKVQWIALAAEEVIRGDWDDEFPLLVFQTGSGTQTNMNFNEVIAHRAMQLAGNAAGRHRRIHPNDEVNLGQSSNDIFPTAMHIAAVEEIQVRLLPVLQSLSHSLHAKAGEFGQEILIGRTHLQDAVPIRLGQVISSWNSQLTQATAGIEQATSQLYELAVGGTAVGTGVNSHPQFGELCAEMIARETGFPFVTSINRFAALAAHDPLINVSASLRTLAAVCMKVANDIRWYASGPRCGIGELMIPENEPGSSIMPGKVNPTQCEALTMIATQVFGNDHTVAFAGSQGNFQLNVFKPVIIHNVLESIGLLADGCRSFDRYCVQGLRPNLRVMQQHLQDSLMLVTALSPYLGYERSAQIAQDAHQHHKTLREAALDSGALSAEQFDRWVRAEELVAPREPPETANLAETSDESQ